MQNKLPSKDALLSILIKEYGIEGIDVKDCLMIERMIETLSDKMVIGYDYDVIQNTGSNWQQVCVYSSDLGKIITEYRRERNNNQTCGGRSIILDGDAVGEFDDIDEFLGQVISWEIEARELLSAIDQKTNSILK
jgi:hypothetical protein